MANDNDNKKQKRRPNALSSQDVYDLMQSSLWYASQNGVPFATENSDDGLVIRLPACQCIMGEDGFMKLTAKG